MKINRFIFIVACCVFAVGYLFNIDVFEQEQTNNQHSGEQVSPVSHKKSKINTAIDGISTWIGRSKKGVIKELGKPEHIVPSAYGYNWLIYKKRNQHYMQVGVNKGKVKTILALGNNLRTEPIKIGENADRIDQRFSLADSISFTYKNTKYTFEFTEKELMTRPLLKVDGHWAQIYIDQMTNEVLAIRYMNTETLLKLRPYSLIYRGNPASFVIAQPNISRNVATALSKQIFNMTNVIRQRYGKTELKWNGKAHQAAFLHSKEMAKKKYFSHHSKWQGDLGDRLSRQKLKFRIAGENIAAHYPDALAVVVGWMNSKGHRVNMLNDQFTELGVGVYEDYYTQDFVTPME